MDVEPLVGIALTAFVIVCLVVSRLFGVRRSKDERRIF